MRSFALPACLAAIAAVSTVPAAAQIVGRTSYEPVPPSSPFLADSRLPGPGIGRDLADARRRIDRARDAGLISRSEARQLRREARLIGTLAHRYGRDGLSPPERDELEARTRRLRASIARPQRGR